MFITSKHPVPSPSSAPSLLLIKLQKPRAQCGLMQFSSLTPHAARTDLQVRRVPSGHSVSPGLCAVPLEVFTKQTSPCRLCPSPESPAHLSRCVLLPGAQCLQSEFSWPYQTPTCLLPATHFPLTVTFKTLMSPSWLWQ